MPCLQPNATNELTPVTLRGGEGRRFFRPSLVGKKRGRNGEKEKVRNGYVKKGNCVKMGVGRFHAKFGPTQKGGGFGSITWGTLGLMIPR